jgi:membrane-associated phospholipid phosphatase
MRGIRETDQRIVGSVLVRGWTMQRRARAIGVAATGVLTFSLLAWLVGTGRTQPFDDTAREVFRPGNRWGPTQARADIVVEGLKPLNTLAVLATVGLVASWWRSSWRPLLCAGALEIATIVLTLSAKQLLGRPDTHQEVTWAGGSFPSGHTAAVIVCVGGTALVLRQRARWWDWTCAALAGGVMGLALLVQAAHWFTDVVGGLMLGPSVLAVVLAGLGPTTARREPGTGRRGPPRTG